VNLQRTDWELDVNTLTTKNIQKNQQPLPSSKEKKLDLLGTCCISSFGAAEFLFSTICVHHVFLPVFLPSLVPRSYEGG
jgi:hypothetical protein